MKKFLISLLFISLTLSILLSAILIYIRSKAEIDTKVKSDVILVLGGTITSGTSCFGPICKQSGFVMRPHYNPCVVARIDHAVSLYKEGFAPKILMSGGNDEETNDNEAEIMKKIASESGVPAENILVENKSTSTYENLLFSQNVINENGLKSVIIVTEPYHIVRAALVASKLNYNYTVSPALESECWNKDDFFANWNFVKKELLALIGYKLQNKI